jgi:hypothetical protein
MANTFDLEFPLSTPREVAQALVADAKKLDGVKGAGVSTPRSIDAATINAWVAVARDALPVAISLVTAIVTLVRGKGLKNVKLRAGNNVEVDVDSGSEADIERLATAALQHA